MLTVVAVPILIFETGSQLDFNLAVVVKIADRRFIRNTVITATAYSCVR